MKAIEELGLSRERFDEIYAENAGFNNQFNKNHPSYSNEETYFAFLRSGANKLINEHESLICDIINKG